MSSSTNCPTPNHTYDGKMWESPNFSDESQQAAWYEIANSKPDLVSVHNAYLELDRCIRKQCRNIPVGYRFYYGTKREEKFQIGESDRHISVFFYTFIYINW